MLLEFRVRNFRSIRDEAVLSLVAAPKDHELASQNLAATGLSTPQKAVRSAVIYGPNASGKSTVLSALNYMRAVVAESATVVQPGQTYNVQPFKLDPESASASTRFEVTFLLHGVRHQYAFEMSQRHIVNESLLVYQRAKPAQWFTRRTESPDSQTEIEFSSYLRGPKKTWADSTRANALFLSTAAQLNSEQLSPVFRWIVDQLMYLPAGAAPAPDVTTEMLKHEEGRLAVRDFLKSADLSIADVQAVARKGFRGHFVFRAGAPVRAHKEDGEFSMPVFEHRASAGSAKFELQDESEGTQRLYLLAAPLMDVLRSGRVLVVDELDTSLHPLLVRRLVSMFHDPQHNSAGAQLIFTTHDTSLLDQNLFRRDQIWFTEKSRDEATILYPLTDFSPRKSEAIERGYLGGRYGAVPVFTETPPKLAEGTTLMRLLNEAATSTSDAQ